MSPSLQDAVVGTQGEQSSQDESCLLCGGIQDWLRPECSQFHGLVVQRAVIWGNDIQQEVDGSIAGFDDKGRLHQEVQVPKASEQRLAAKFSKAACSLGARARKAGLPEAVCQQAETDATEIAIVLQKLVPETEEIVMKLELMGEGVCERFHQDYYVGRAIVTYNGSGTVYLPHSNVDFWELDNCGNNDCVVKDKSRVFAANTGDVFFIKGKTFPGKANGLVHKSPAKEYHASGAIKNRLVLKVDLP